MLRCLLFGLAVSLVGGCTVPIDHDNFVRYSHPVTSVSAESVSVGSWVTVNVKTTFRLFETSHLAENSIDFKLGVCLVPYVMTGENDYCTVDTIFTVVDGMTVADGQELSKADRLLLKRGESVTYEHNVQLSSSEPGSITVMGILLLDDPNDKPYGASGILQGPQRVFVEFVQ